MKKYYKYMFLAAAWWNYLAGISFFFGHKQIFQFLGMRALNYPVIIQLLSSFVFVFGVGCYWASKDMYNNTGAIKMSIMGRIFVFVLFLLYVIKKDIPPFFLIIGLIDLIFAILFFRALTYIKKIT